MYIYIYIYIYIIYISIYIYNVPFRLLLILRWLYGNSCSWARDTRLHIAGTNEPKSTQKVKQKSITLILYM